jgi:LmbE family N-acetylglucosaminyl deacetylase
VIAFALAMALSPSLNPSQPDAAHLLRSIERLQPAARVLYIAAHPDDENTRLLAWLVHDKKLRTAYLSITRGDGGQNLIGTEQGPALGLLRTQELLAARRTDGAEQFFTRARDFGYSKSHEETLRLWGQERILEDVVWIYRTFRPDVVVTRFHPDHLDTHGQHVASARLAVAALAAAADPAFAPEQVKRAGTWKVRRVVWNGSPFFLKPGEDTSRFLKEDVGTYDALLGASMGEIAADSRSMHKSQGFGAARQRGPTLELFEHLAGDPARKSFLDGVPAPKQDAAIAKALAAFEPGAPQKAVPALLEALAAAQGEQRDRIAEVIAACAGLHLDAVAERTAVAPGGSLPVTLNALLRTGTALSVESVALQRHEPWQKKVTLAVPRDARLSDPDWLLQPPRDGHFEVDDLDARVRPEPPPSLFHDFAVRIGDRSFTLRRPVLFRWVDPVLGERTRAAIVVPPATVDAASSTLLFTDDEPRTLRVIARAPAGAAKGTVHVEAPAGFTVAPASRPFQLESAGAEVELRFEVKAARGAHQGALRLVADVDGARSDRGLRRIDHAHVPPQQWHPRSAVRAARFDLRRGGTRVGYVMGAGDEIPAALAQVGYSVIALDEAALRDGHLDSLDAIVIGVRAYNVHPWLAAMKPRLLEWVERGGTLVVQYQTKNRLSRLPEPLGPFDFSVSQERVTDETSAVELARSDDPVLQAPNRIGAADFDGWVQERGLYFADSWDGRYAAPLAMHDPGEQPLRGSLIVARHGKGRFVYTGLAFFRQLPAGVTGAFRLFANLLARDPQHGP